jgi:HK97 family phage prohead protease
MKKYLEISTKSLEELGVKTHKELWAKAQKDGYSGMEVCINAEFTKSIEDDNSFHAIFSTANEDRHGDVVVQDWDLRYFKKNNVLLDSHNYDSIENIIGKITNIKQDKVLEGDVSFHLANPKGVLAREQVKDGFGNALSVGFIPKEFDDKGTIMKSELLEVSKVSVPANAEALFVKEEIKEEIIEKKEEPIIVSLLPTKKQKLMRVVKQMADEQRNNLIALQKAVNALTQENKESKKQDINRIIRSLVKQGIDINS